MYNRASRLVRVLYVNHSRSISGSDISLATLLGHLSPAVEAHLLSHFRLPVTELFELAPERIYRDRAMPQAMTTQAGGRLPPHQVLAHGLKSAIAPGTIARLRRRWDIELVHANESTQAAYALSASLLGLPVVVHVRGRVDPSRPAARLLDQLAARPRVAFVAIDAEVHASLSPLCRSRARVIHNPVHFERAPTAADGARLRAAWGVPMEACVVGQVATLHAYKGVWRVLELAERLCAERAELHFVLVGADPAEGGQADALREAARERGLEDRFHLVGHHQDLAAVYAALDVALCLFGEQLGGIGRTAYEAAMAGLPVVATLPDASGSDTFPDGEAGRVLEPADVVGIAGALRELIAAPSARTALGERAREVVAARHAAPVVARQVEDLYRELLGGGR